jgi:D-erythrulose 4-kinase
MTRLYNAPEDFADEMVRGFVAANGRYVRAVPGGVVRSTVSPAGEVAVVIGGGSGHYPAFGGLVGPGLAHGAAMGNLFASPSMQQARSVATAAQQGGGVLFTYGNYAGDVLNFDAAQEQLRAAGISCETVTVTDDVSSAPLGEKHKRRGIAGDLTVFKAAGAAAAEGYDLEGVVRVARLANERTRSFGVAFTGCTLPGAEEPLFTVPDGRMAVGLGIHGEPGIGETDVPTAAGLAELLVGRLLEELPEGVAAAQGARVVPILNGLGAVKYEELFVVFGRVAETLEQAGVEVVDPQVGEFCTSFDMAGASLTLFWVDEELERLWSAPADTSAFRRGSVAPVAYVDAIEAVAVEAHAVPDASDESRETAERVADLIATVRGTIDLHVDQLGRLDAIAGDGDHGIGMQRGSHAAEDAARAAIAAGAGAGTVLERAGDAWSDRAGGTSGALWGMALRSLGGAIGDKQPPHAASVAAGVAAATDGIRAYGKAKVGDKTMVDALVPFSATLTREVEAGTSITHAWDAAADAAVAAAAATSDLLPRVGRARPHAEKSLGTPDPGAHSFALIVRAVADALAERASLATKGTNA